MKVEDRKVYEIIENSLGLAEEEIDVLFEKNSFLKLVIPKDILDLLDFFRKYGLTNEEMKNVSKTNPYFLTEVFERAECIDKFLGMVGITDMRNMIVTHPISISQNPIDIKNFIEENRENGKSDKEIKEMLLNDFEKYFTL